VTREVFDKVDGVPQFRSWGGEDDIFYRRVYMRVPVKREYVEGFYHQWHPKQCRDENYVGSRKIDYHEYQAGRSSAVANFDKALHAEHTDWHGELLLYCNGRMARPGIAEGTYEFTAGQHLILDWDRGPTETLNWDPARNLYRDATQDFTVCEVCSHGEVKDDPVGPVAFGLGTGRCGTGSLARLLQIPHEADGPLPWEVECWRLEMRLERWSKQRAKFHGDVGFYYLPYVELLNERLKCRFICLTRNKQQVIDSYLRHAAELNHWALHDGSTWRIDPKWDAAFPKYDCPSKAEAIGRYWEEYHEEARRLEQQLDNFRIYPIDALNCTEGRLAILSFALDKNFGDSS
jgi:hypothetical protein